MSQDDTIHNKPLVVHITQSAEAHPNRWVKFEHISKALSIAAIPVALAVLAHFLNARLGAQSVQREYVTLAVSILQEPDEAKSSRDLKQWAAELLNQNAPVKLPPALMASLKSGEAVLPTATAGSLATGSITASPGSIRVGEHAELRWNSTNADRVLIVPSVGFVGAAGRTLVSPTSTTTYTLIVMNSAGGYGIASVEVAIAD